MKSRKIFYFISLLSSYYKDLRFSKGSNIKLFNFWPLAKPQDLWFHDFINKNKILNSNKSLSFYSVCGDRNKLKLDFLRRKIFYTGENPDFINNYHDHCLSDVDLSLGFDYIDNEKYLRFPIWYLYFIDPKSNLTQIQNWINDIEINKNVPEFSLRKFCCMVSSHDNYSGNRVKLFNSLSTISTVDSGGKLLNNTTDLWKIYNDDKNSFLKNYKFNICVENSNRSGYVTEKIFQSIVAGCLPVYWGSNNAPEANILNQKRILFFDPKNEILIVKKINDLLQ